MPYTSPELYNLKIHIFSQTSNPENPQAQCYPKYKSRLHLKSIKRIWNLSQPTYPSTKI